MNSRIYPREILEREVAREVARERMRFFEEIGEHFEKVAKGEEPTDFFLPLQVTPTIFFTKEKVLRYSFGGKTRPDQKIKFNVTTRDTVEEWNFTKK